MDFVTEDSEDGVDDVTELVPEVEGDRIEFCIPRHQKGQFEAPAPASEFVPDWYKQLEVWMEGDENTSFQMTVAGCRPFFDSMNFGYVVPTPQEFHMEVTADGEDWQANWEGDFDTLGKHSLEQIGGEMFPADIVAVVKFHNPWLIRTPPGYSTLFMPVLNRPSLPFTPFSGVVDTDKYHNQINFPAMWFEKGFDEKIPAGTPLVQAIPFERDSVLGKSIRRTMTNEEQEVMNLTSRRVNRTNKFYSGEIWCPKKGERDVTNEPDTEAPEGSELEDE